MSMNDGARYAPPGPDAEAAIEAVLRSVPSEEVIKRLESLVADNARLKRAFATHRSASS